MRKIGGTKALLLAAGLGMRLQPLTAQTPKCLVEINGRPLLFHWAEKLKDAGITEALINTHHLAEQVRAAIVAINASGALTLRERFEPTLLGSAGTLRANASFLDNCDRIVIVYADNYSEVDLRDVLAYHGSHNLGLTIMLFQATNPSACGIAETDPDDLIVRFTEKPDHPCSDLANAGLYVCDADIYREFASIAAQDIGRDILSCFAGRMKGYRFNGFHRDIGTPESLLAVEHYLSNRGQTATHGR